MMNNAYTLKETVQFLIFTNPISLHGENFATKLALNILLKIKKDLIHFRTFLKQINPSKLAKIINETYIIRMFAYRERSRTPYIRKYLLQRNNRHTSGYRIG
jgi:hypothetical protein